MVVEAEVPPQHGKPIERNQRQRQLSLQQHAQQHSLVQQSTSARRRPLQRQPQVNFDDAEANESPAAPAPEEYVDAETEG